MTLRIVTAVLALAAAAGQPRPPAPIPVIVELFTSEGCSSCPPADELLAQIEKLQPFRGVEVIAMGEHVDYWNQLGWPDRFASAMFTARQQDYGRLFALESVYTPQMVVNGQAQVLGSDGAAAQREIFKAAQGPRAAVEMSMLPGEVLTLKVGRVPASTRQADILLAVTETGIESDVRWGENRGHTLRHTGVVRSLASLAVLDSRKAGVYTADARVNLKPEWKRENLKVVLFVQDRSNRRILGAAALRP
jgi:hypothetical protein